MPFWFYLEFDEQFHFPGIGARNPKREAATKRAVRETTYLGIFRSGMFQRYRKFQGIAEVEDLPWHPVDISI